MTAKLLWCYFKGHNILNNTTIRRPQKMVAVGNDALVKSPVSRDTSCRKFQPWQPVATRSSPEVDFETTNHLQRLGHHRCHLWLLGSGGRWGRHWNWGWPGARWSRLRHRLGRSRRRPRIFFWLKGWRWRRRWHGCEPRTASRSVLLLGSEDVPGSLGDPVHVGKLRFPMIVFGLRKEQ